jgi:predicted MFS family arabinose efflux permease
MLSNESRYGALLLLAFGTFAIGIDGFVIAGILPAVASDLSVSAALVGQLVTAYALAYAIASPILTTVTNRILRRDLMIASMGVISLANFFAACSANFGSLLIANTFLGMAAGLYVPAANALAGVLVGTEKRGFAIAIINVGLTLAIAFGVSIGSFLASKISWHITFACVSLLSAVAALGLCFGLPRSVGSHLSVPSMRERMRLAKQPGILPTLLTTTLWAAGTYTVYTYLALYLHEAAALTGSHIAYLFFVWGISAGFGLLLCGLFVDRIGPHAVMIPCLLVVACAFALMSMFAHLLSPVAALVPVSISIAVWAMAHWGFHPGQEIRLMRMAGLNLAPVALSLNASFLYLGRSIGAIAGSLVISHQFARDLGFFADVFEVASIILLLTSVGRVHMRTPVSTAAVEARSRSSDVRAIDRDVSV